MEKKRFYALRSFLQGITDAKLTVYASSGAFFLFLSLFPMVLLGCSFLPLTALTQDYLTNYLSALLPDIVSELIAVIVDQVYDSTITAISLSALLVLWSASKAFLGLLRGINAVCGVDTPKNYFRLRARSGVCVALLMIVTLITLVLIVFEHRMLNLLTESWPAGNFIREFVINFRFLMILIMLALVFMLVYKWMPYKRMRAIRQIPGAVIAAALWMLLSWFFSFYVRNFGSISIYGSLTTVILAMFWMYYSMFIILFGAYVNVRLEKRREDENAENGQRETESVLN
ncbi:MAG: YihY/virulence factor BrkB family protein [Oscillospiraceae bacterium]|nr:YihY/virulence factor BrkB family protein [Oscillospiraceae bacterium]